VRLNRVHKSGRPAERNVHAGARSHLDSVNEVHISRAYPDMVDDDAPRTFPKHGKSRALRVGGQVDSNERHGAKVAAVRLRLWKAGQILTLGRD